jgi:acetate kinase
MADVILVLNAGSSSLKFSAFFDRAPPQPFVRGQLEALTTAPRFMARNARGETIAEKEWLAGTKLDHAGAIEFLFEWGRSGILQGHQIVAAGHRVGHGGLKYTCPVPITNEVLADLDQLVPLAPLHQPHNLAAIRVVAERAPQLPQVACFDTAFHRHQPLVAQQIALPRALNEEGVVRYGFHGLSYEYIASVLPEIDPRAARGRTVVAHLGNGASMCAMNHGHSIATTMGFSALDGLPMGTRCGSIDPGVLLYLLDRHHFDVHQLEELLYKQSGLLGVSGIASDMRTLLVSRDPHAAEAVDLFVYRLGRELGSLAAAIGGLDALVFTGGIGENAPAIRQRVCHDAAWLGLKLDEAANQTAGPCITLRDSQVVVWVIPTNEELMIAQHTQQLLRCK